MKMTRLEWRYLQKIALDHPYFDTHELPLTEKEAEAIVKANIRMTGKEFVDSIYAQLGMTRPSEVKKPFAWLRSIGEQFTIPPIRKSVITALAILLLIVFFAATPMGQAIAESVIQYIVTLFEDGSLSVQRGDNKASSIIISDDSVNTDEDQDESDDTASYVFLNSFEDYVRVTGKTPLVLPFPYSSLYYVYDPEIDYLEIHSTYDAPNGEIIAYQIWDVEALVFSTSTGYKVHDADESFFVSIEDEEGYIRCKKVLEDSVYTLSSKGNYTADELVHLLKNEASRSEGK